MNSPKAPCLLLLVPDETRGEFIRHLLRAAKPDAEFISATRLDEALRKLEGGSVAAAIAEGAEGIALINSVCEQGLDVPVVFIAPDDDGDLLDQARAAGASEAIFRSELSPATLQNALHYALLWRAQETNDETAASKAKHAEIVSMARTESLARLASSISHEVRNPLSLIYLAADFLARPKPLTEEARANIVGYLRSGAGRIEEVITSALAACAPRELSLAAHDANDIVEEALRLAKTRLRADAPVQFHKDMSVGMPAIFADRSRMVSAIHHLLTNAIDAMPDGGDLTVTTRVHSFTSSERAEWQREGWFRAGDVAVIIEIADTGHGIPPDKLSHIYELFFTTKPAGHGAGLGLATIKKIIQLHNGRIAITNRPEGGVLAELTLKTAATQPV